MTSCKIAARHLRNFAPPPRAAEFPEFATLPYSCGDLERETEVLTVSSLHLSIDEVRMLRSLRSLRSLRCVALKIGTHGGVPGVVHRRMANFAFVQENNRFTFLKLIFCSPYEELKMVPTVWRIRISGIRIISLDPDP